MTEDSTTSAASTPVEPSQPEHEEVAVLSLPMKVTSITQLVAALEQVYGKTLFLPTHEHGDGFLVIGRWRDE